MRLYPAVRQVRRADRRRLPPSGRQGVALRQDLSDAVGGVRLPALQGGRRGDGDRLAQPETGQRLQGLLGERSTGEVGTGSGGVPQGLALCCVEK